MHMYLQDSVQLSKLFVFFKTPACNSNGICLFYQKCIETTNTIKLQQWNGLSRITASSTFANSTKHSYCSYQNTLLQLV